jgi:hypothetical protein
LAAYIEPSSLTISFDRLASQTQVKVFQTKHSTMSANPTSTAVHAFVFDEHESKYWSLLDYIPSTICGLRDHCGCKPVGTRYQLSDKKVTITKKTGGFCGMCQDEEIDNIEMKQIIDADVVSKAPPPVHMICCGQRRDFVTIKTKTGNDTYDDIVLSGGKGKELARLIMERN